MKGKKRKIIALVKQFLAFTGRPRFLFSSSETLFAAAAAADLQYLS